MLCALQPSPEEKGIKTLLRAQACGLALAAAEP